jgi:peptide/nickel transport system ATP-binding protein
LWLLQSSNHSFFEIRDLAVTYSFESERPIHALDGIRLDICPGEVIGILGESGCGKSTLANALLQLLPDDAKLEGTIFFCGRDLVGLPGKSLREIRGRVVSLIPQDPASALNPLMTVGSQIREVLRAHFSSIGERNRNQVIDLLREVGFDQPDVIYSAYPHQLSGGQRQRIVVAQAVACRPSLLIADEPTSKLDPALKTEIVALLSDIRKQHGTAILVISHDPTVLAGIADRIAVMYAGRIVEAGTSAAIFSRPLHPYTQALMRIATSSVITGAMTKGRIPSIDGESPNPSCLSVGCRFEPRCSERMDICSRRYPLEFMPQPSRPVNCFKYGE